MKIKIFDTASLTARIDKLPYDEMQEYLQNMTDVLHIMQTDLDEVRNVKLREMLYNYIEELLGEAEEEQELENKYIKDSIPSRVLETLTRAGFTIPDLKRALTALNI